MAETNWDLVSGSLTGTDTDTGKSTSQTPPAGGGSAIYGFRSLTAVVGAVAHINNQTFFNPMISGGRVSGAMKRFPSAGSTGWSCFVFTALQADSVDADCYMLGLSDASPAKIVLRKGKLSDGIKTSVVGADGVLAVSNASVVEDVWTHLRLDATRNLNNDVVLNVKQNDLSTNDVDEMAWQSILGMAQVTDDAFGAETGSNSLFAGRAGFGYEQRAITRTAFFDQVEVARQ